MKNSVYFSKAVNTEVIELTPNLPDIKEILSVIIDPEILSLKALNSLEGLSEDGEYLSGKKIAAEICLRQKIMYLADCPERSIHVLENDFFQIVYLVVPKYLEGTAPEELLKYKLLKAQVLLEDYTIKAINKRSVFKTVFLYLDLVIVPTYQLAYCSYESDSTSNIFMVYSDGLNNTKLTNGRSYRNIRPIWSPSGQEIAFLSNKEGEYLLYLFSLAKFKSRRITDPQIFKKVYSFDWRPTNEEIVFSSMTDNTKELFLIKLIDLEVKPLTAGNGLVNSFRPKFSPDGSSIAFLREVAELTNLFIIDNDGRNCRQITFNGFVKEFAWDYNNNYLAYISGNNCKTDQLTLVDLVKGEEIVLPVRQGETNLVKLKNIKFSPGDNIVTFIGANSVTENIYFYELKKREMKNITNNLTNVFIYDYVWQIDGSKIYYSCNELGLVNVYSLSLKNMQKVQITNTNSMKTHLSYRPRIK